jgi:tRNA G18 (ribose-2'-O)-methylase SpoU
MPAESTSALQAAEKLNALKGHDFSRAASDLESTWASAPEGCFPSITPEISTFSATCLAADGLHSPISRGIPAFSAKSKAEPLIVVLAGLQDPGNLGTILRSAEAFGASGVVSLPGTVSAWNPKAVRASAGSVFRVPLLAAGTEECFRRLRAAKVRILATAVQSAEAVQNADLAEGVAFLIGNEGNGVAEEIAAQADGAITIPCPGPVESLNAAVAASVLLYEASRQRGGSR